MGTHQDAVLDLALARDNSTSFWSKCKIKFTSPE